MLQIDHVYEFLYQELFKDFVFHHLVDGVPKATPNNEVIIFMPHDFTEKIIFFYDQEPFISQMSMPYMEKYNLSLPTDVTKILVTSEYSDEVNSFSKKYNNKNMYYFFHGFAALDWYRGFYALNYNKSVIHSYSKDFISYNRLINNDRSYRIYFLSKLIENNLLDRGLISFGVVDDHTPDWRDELADPDSKLSDAAKSHIETHLTNINKLVIDSPYIHGSASANIPRNIIQRNQHTDDAFWHIVTETVFYYPKLHLTEKIFKPIVSKQPFLLIAAPGNLAYLRNYGFKTFGNIIDESYDSIHDNDARVDAVVKQLAWYCNLSEQEKSKIITEIEPIVEYNFNHFYNEFKNIIVQELLDNSRTLFKEIGYDDKTIAYDDVYKILTN